MATVILLGTRPERAPGGRFILCAIQLADELGIRPFWIIGGPWAGGLADLPGKPGQRIFERRLQLIIRQSEICGYRSG